MAGAEKEAKAADAEAIGLFQEKVGLKMVRALRDIPFGPTFFDMKVAEAKRRLEITHVASVHYHYLTLVPRNDQEKILFKEARVALSMSTFLPRQIWLQQANGDEVTWDFPRMRTDARERPLDFMPPNPPAGWKLERVGK
jgi:hypothetical protein